ncbi:deoxyribose-phosphate aldolase [Roseibium denhamense]|uniref:Deoxyribose-phosphate aldolase n=1 Tax=Roseibium denhamense TaxID=76305 RepID=A0ABY1P1W0_9HYPH|nr:deoxyribose-phosphate aldolase [Roseibium denhamense]MTI05104.1 deoxyribose-phosphate aldolase [Roseibium denhamense]SMP22859.1 deoxyribose-phosphate aldolase [Roseibium denhamense]
MSDMIETAKRALGLVDLTNLNDDCTAEDITSLTARTVTDHGSVAAVCVWPRFVAQAVKELTGTGVKVATVVNFPDGGEDTEAVVAETQKAIADGADEIDLVMPYKAFASGRKGFAEEQIIRVKAAIPAPAILKVILETGEIKDPLLIHAASNIAIAAGADFIKTSTGKVSVNATLEAAEIMLTAIEEARREEAERVIGFKPAGGIKTTVDAASYLELADRIMGHNWVSASTFRFGASSLLDALIATIEGKEATAKEGY